MSDDNNDRLMEQFIDKATPKLLEAMQTQITEHVEKQIGGLVENSTKLLDEVKDAQRQRDEAVAKQTEDFSQLKNLLESGQTTAEIKDHLNPEPIKLTREQARDRQVYLRAKTQAEQNGTSIQIIAE